MLDLDARNWTVRVGGKLDRPRPLSMKELMDFKQIEVINTMECAGNGRAFVGLPLQESNGKGVR